VVDYKKDREREKYNLKMKDERRMRFYFLLKLFSEPKVINSVW
jgi:hypothetical protein